MKEMDIFNELIKYQPGLLEKPIEELVPISFIGDAAVAAYRTIINQLKRMDQLDEQNQKTLCDGQDAGKMQLLIQAAIGIKLREDIPDTGTGGAPGQPRLKNGAAKMTETQRTTARTISKHPEVIEEVIQEAEENEDIPTKTAVLNKVRLKREQVHRKEAEKREVPDGIVSLEEQSYLMKLEKTLYACPKESEIPKNWHDQPFKQACNMAKIIYNRLEVLLNETENISD